MILFYSTKDRYGFFSNFSRHPITLDGTVWPTTEHYFQAMKFWPHRPDLVSMVQQAESPSEAADLGRDKGKPLRADWDNQPIPEMWKRIPYTQPVYVRDGVQRDKRQEPIFARTKDVVMFVAVYTKFTQYTDLKQHLLDTDREKIVEDAKKDSYWGWGANQKGENKLGRILMMIRAYLIMNPGL